MFTINKTTLEDRTVEFGRGKRDPSFTVNYIISRESHFSDPVCSHLDRIEGGVSGVRGFDVKHTSPRWRCRQCPLLTHDEIKNWWLKEHSMEILKYSLLPRIPRLMGVSIHIISISVPTVRQSDFRPLRLHFRAEGDQQGLRCHPSYIPLTQMESMSTAISAQWSKA